MLITTLIDGTRYYTIGKLLGKVCIEQYSKGLGIY